MALLTNINGKFSVSDAGAVRFNDSFTFPTSDGAANYFLQTNGSGTIGWAAAPTGSGATNRVAYWSTASNLSYNDSFQFDGSHVTITGRLDFVASAGTYGPYITSSDGDDVQIHYNGNDAGTFEIWNHNQNGGAAVRMLKISDTSTATFGSSSLDINVEVTGNIQVDGGFKDSSGDIGTAGQILSSTATGTNWINNGGGTITGSGAANRVAYWTSASNISSDGAFRFDGTNVAIGGAIVASRKLAIYNTNADNELEFIGTDYTNIYSQTDSTMAVEVTGSGALRLATTGGNLTIATGGNATFSGDVTTDGNVTTDGIYKMTTAPDGNILELDQGGRSMDIGVYFSSNSTDSEWQFKTSTGATDGATTNALVIKPLQATFAGDVVSNAIVQANGFRTTTGSTDYSLLSRNSANTAVYIQQAGTGNIVDFRYGSQAAGQGTSAMLITNEGQIQFNRTGQPPVTNSLYGNVVLQTDASANFQRIRYDVGTTPYWGLTKLGTSNNFAIAGRIDSTWNDHVLEIAQTTGNVGISTPSANLTHPLNIYRAASTGPIICLEETTIANGSAEGGSCNDLGRIQWQSADTSTSQGGLVRGVIRVRPGECAYGTGGVIDIGTLDTYTGASTSAWQVRMQIESNGLVRHKFSTELGTTSNGVTNQFTTRVAGYGVLDPGTGNRYGSYGWINLHATTNYTGGSRQYAITNAYKANKFAILVGGTTGSGGSAPTLTGSGEVGSGTSLGLCVDGTGVGIGTGAPSAIFHVSGNSFQIGAGYGIYGNADAANYHIKGSSSGSQLIVKWYSGVLWQGNGTTNIMQIENTGDLTVKGDVVAYGSPSDKRLKENIKPIESALDKAMKLQGVTFDWKKQKQITEKSVKREWKHDVGFIAQDVQKVIPELVRENEDGMLSMRHQGITPILLEAIKELKAEIEELKKQIK